MVVNVFRQSEVCYAEGSSRSGNFLAGRKMGMC